jgi:hypothetical protein
MVIARCLTSAVERPAAAKVTTWTPVLGASRPVVVRLAGLFAMDSFGGGFVVQAFIAFWLAERFNASVAVIGVTFLRCRGAADRVVSRYRAAGRAVRAVGHHGVHPPALERLANHTASGLVRARS